MKLGVLNKIQSFFSRFFFYSWLFQILNYSIFQKEFIPNQFPVRVILDENFEKSNNHNQYFPFEFEEELFL